MQKASTQILTSIAIFLMMHSACLATSPEQTSQPRLNTAQIESITGVKGRLEKDNSFKISMPRDDLKINVNGVKISPAMGLTSWVSFKKAGKESYMQGDLVLTPDQINPIISLALKSGVQVTTLQNRFLWDSPQVVFMHIECVGKENRLAAIVEKLFEKIKATSDGKGDLPYANMDPAETTLDPIRLNKLLGIKGILKDGVYKINILNNQDDDSENNNKPTFNSWAAFVGTNEEAAVDGNFVVNEELLQKVLLVLNKAGIYVVGIHQNISDSDPTFVFIHYWGIGNTKNLAKGIRSVLDLQKEVADSEDD